MIDNDLVQSSLLTQANTTPLITSSFPSGTVVEYNFQGTDWHYPAARIHIEDQRDLEDYATCPSVVEFSWYIFSEKASSKEANNLAYKFVSAFRGLSFSQNHVKFVKIKILENIPAIRQDERTWRSQVRCQSIIHSI